MLHVPGDFNIDSIMRLNKIEDSNFQIAGTWGDIKKIPWKIFLHEPDDHLKPAQWLLRMGAGIYPLSQSSAWVESDGEFGRGWYENKGAWKIGTADGRLLTSLKDLDDDLVIDE
jgi:hypothetical protein